MFLAVPIKAIQTINMDKKKLQSKKDYIAHDKRQTPLRTKLLLFFRLVNKPWRSKLGDRCLSVLIKKSYVQIVNFKNNASSVIFY